MTDKEILKKAIKKAVKNGFLKDENKGFTDKEYIELYRGKTIQEAIVNYIMGEIWGCEGCGYSNFIFSHGFAKAFWGEEEVCYDCGQILEADEGDGLMCKNCCEHAGWDDNLGDADGQPAWQYHLQKMVISENPIKYLEEFIK